MCIHANIEPLSWESEFFQRSSAKLNFLPSSPLVKATELNAYQRVQAKIPAERLDLVDGLYALDFQLVEGEIDLIVSIEAENASTQRAKNNTVKANIVDPSTECRHKMRVAAMQDISLLRHMAGKAFALSPFRTPWYNPRDSGRFYALWAESAVLGTFDHQCLLIEDDLGQIAGFVTMRDLQNGDARIGLLASCPDAQGKGIGTQLVLAAKQWCQHRGLYRLQVATQISNTAALRLYIRSGALVASIAYWFYRG